MATPNSYNFVVTRDNVITDAMLHINAIGTGETPASGSVTEAARILNMLLKLRANEVPLWSIRRGYVLPFTDASSIDTNSHVVTGYASTTMSANEAAGQTDMDNSFTSTTGMAQDDAIGIELDDGSMHWTTLATVAPAVGLTDALPSAASTGNYVYWYTASADRVVRPLRILDANILNIVSNSSWEITIEERKDYFNLSGRTSAGIPNRIFYDPVLGSRVADPATAAAWYGTIYVYPRFDAGKHLIEFTYQEPIQDVDAASDNLYIPQEFYLPITLELAALLGPRYGVPHEERKALHAEATFYREAALQTVAEEGSLFLQPDDTNG